MGKTRGFVPIEINLGRGAQLVDKGDTVLRVPTIYV